MTLDSERLDPGDRARATILIVEDDAAMRELLLEEPVSYTHLTLPTILRV